MISIRNIGLVPTLLSLAVGTHAQTVVNGAFENPTTPANPGYTSTAPDNFTASPGGSSGVQTFASVISSSPGTDPDGGAQFAYIGSGSIFQQFTTPLVAGTTYTLTGFVGERTLSYTGHGSLGLFTFSNGAPADVLATSGIVSPTAGAFTRATATFTATAAQAGGNFGVVLAKTGGSQADFDDITLTVTPAPEPSEAAALGVGLLGLVGLTLAARKRRVGA